MTVELQDQRLYHTLIKMAGSTANFPVTAQEGCLSQAHSQQLLKNGVLRHLAFLLGVRFRMLIHLIY
uniref:Uncharacterized protein n=1 Tax=Arundo donax TaxID=35708 RepID=A0A0A9G5T7_ARUDO